MDAKVWDERYSGTDMVWSATPNQFLPPEVDGLAPGTALDLACGEGRNAIWLAEQGWTVTGVDFSQVGIDKSRRLATERGVTGTWITADATSWTPTGAFDLVVIFYLQLPASERRAAVRTAISSLAVGGTFLLVGHDLLNLTEGHGGPKDADVLQTAEDILDDLAQCEVDSDRELVIERSGRVERVVHTDAGERTAIDTLVRARRVA